MKSTIRNTICPVPVLVVPLLLCCCGGGDNELEEDVSIHLEPVHAEAFPLDGFRAVSAPPDTLSLRWFGEGAADITTVQSELLTEVNFGDTLFTLVEYLSLMELERLSMELDFARTLLVSNPTDSVLVRRTDSLDLLLDSLEVHDQVVYLSPLEGIITDLEVEIGETVRPGDVLGAVSVSNSVVFYIYPPHGCRIDMWPAEAGELRLVEQLPELAVYSGERSEFLDEFSIFASVPREAVFESDLDSYLITVDGDTVLVIRAGSMENGRILVIPQRPITELLSTWTLR